MTSDERMRILNMVKENKISLEEADELLESMGEVATTPLKQKGKAKFLRIRIKSEDNEKVNVNLPLSVARWALNMVPENVKEKMQTGENPVDLEDIIHLIHDGMEGQKLVDIHDDDGNIVEIYVD